MVNVVRDVVLPLVIGGGLVVLIVILLRKTKRMKKHDRLTAEYLLERFHDLQRVLGILVIHRESGVNVFSKSLKKVQFLDQSELVSGVIQAVSILGKEFAPQHKLSRLEYGNFKLSCSEGQHVRVILLSEAERDLSSAVEDNLLMFLRKFEKRFHVRLAEWQGNLAAFTDADEIFASEFETVPFIEALAVRYDPAQSVEFLSPQHEYILKKAHALCEDQGFVTFASIIAALEGDAELKKEATPKGLLPYLYQLYESRFFTPAA